MHDAATRLGRKLAALDLEPDERAVLVALIGAKASPLDHVVDEEEVTGFLLRGDREPSRRSRGTIQFA